MARAHSTWTREQARDWSRKANEAKRLRAANSRAMLEQGAKQAESPDYTFRLKGRVRAQIDLVLTRIDEELSKSRGLDAQHLDRLASAFERLYEAERVLDGRPGPGTRRPPREDPQEAKPVRSEAQHLGAATQVVPEPRAVPKAEPQVPYGQPQVPPTPSPKLTEPPEF